MNYCIFEYLIRQYLLNTKTNAILLLTIYMRFGVFGTMQYGKFGW